MKSATTLQKQDTPDTAPLVEFEENQGLLGGSVGGHGLVSLLPDILGWLFAGITLWLFYTLAMGILHVHGKPRESSPPHTRPSLTWETEEAPGDYVEQGAVTLDTVLSGVLGWKRRLESRAIDMHHEMKTRRTDPDQAEESAGGDGIEQF